jgi:hypothetical protein
MRELGRPSYQGVCRFDPAHGGVAEGTVVVAKLVRPFMAVTAHIVEVLKVGPVMARETIRRGVVARELYGVDAERRFSPGVG